MCQYKELRAKKKTIMSYFKVLHNPDIYFKRPGNVQTVNGESNKVPPKQRCKMLVAHHRDERIKI